MNNELEPRPDAIDKMVFSATLKIRYLTAHAYEKLNLKQRSLSPVTIMQRSVPE